MKNIFATLEYVVEKIKEAITSHKNDEQAHPKLTQQINSLRNIKFIPSDLSIEGRNIPTKPNDYVAGLFTSQLKESDVLGVNSRGYAHILGVNAWSDCTADVHELVFNGSKIFHRVSNDPTTWLHSFELANVLDYQIKTFSWLGAIGCNHESTFQQIASAMPNNSRIVYSQWARSEWFPSFISDGYNDIEITRYGGGEGYVKVTIRARYNIIAEGWYTPTEGLNWKQIAVIDKKDITSNLINGFEIVDIGRDELICSRNGDIVSISGRIINRIGTINSTIITWLDSQFRPKRYRRISLYAEQQGIVLRAEIKPNGEFIIYDERARNNEALRVNITYTLS